MTNKEAIDMLTSIRDYLCNGNPTWKTEPIRDAVNMAIDAIRKDEPNSSEKPNNCEELNAYRECVKSRSFWDSKHCDGCYFDERCPFDEPKTEPTISKMEQVDKDINVRSKTEPQTLDDIGKQIQDAYDKGFLSDADAVQAWYEAVKDEPQTERSE